MHNAIASTKGQTGSLSRDVAACDIAACDVPEVKLLLNSLDEVDIYSKKKQKITK